MTERKINIVQFLPYFPPHKGGIQTFAEEWSRAFVALGYGQVLNVVFSIGQEEGALEYERWGYHVFVFPAFEIVKGFPCPKFWNRSFWQILGRIRDWKPDIVQTHTRFFLSSSLGGLFAKQYRIKWVHIEHGSWFVVSDKWIVVICSRLYDWIIGNWTFRAADGLVAISDACRRFIQKTFVDRNIAVVYQGMEIPLVSRIPPTDGKVRITFVGRLVHLKGVRYLLEAIKLLKEEGIRDISCRIAGDGEERDELETFVRDNGLETEVAFLGFVSKNTVLTEVLPRTDIFVNPSLQEWLPTTVIEALLSRCMVIATDVGGTREISDKEDLIIVQPDNSVALYDGIKTALWKYEEVSWVSYESVRDKFDSERNIERIFEVYEGII